MNTNLSRVDPLSWLIYLDIPIPSYSQRELWDFPSLHPTMNQIIHEHIHFWHSISTYQGIHLAFDCLKSMNAFRFAARSGVELLKIDQDWNFDGYEPFQFYKEFTKSGVRIKKLHEYTEIDTKVELSPFHIFEGLAKYWDVIITYGYGTHQDILSHLKKESIDYRIAFEYAENIIGDVAFILFPIFSYFALCSENPVFAFVNTLNSYQNNGFKIPRGINFQDAWIIAYDKTLNWDGLLKPIYAPMSTYASMHKRYVSWKLRYAGLIPEDNPLIGHPVLEEYIQQLMSIARERYPNKSDYDREVLFIEEFVIPGNPFYRRTLSTKFHPSLILFNDFNCWASPIREYKDNPDLFKKSMDKFNVMMGICKGLISNSNGVSRSNNCPHVKCPMYEYGLCEYVINYPREPDICEYRELAKTEFKIL